MGAFGSEVRATFGHPQRISSLASKEEHMKKSLLNSSGRIPSHTECPFRKDCTIAKQGECKHEGLKHSVPFSCGAARLHDTIHRYETQANGNTE